MTKANTTHHPELTFTEGQKAGGFTNLLHAERRVCTHLMGYALTYKLITLVIGRTNVMVVVDIKKARQEAQAQLSCC